MGYKAALLISTLTRGWNAAKTFTKQPKVSSDPTTANSHSTQPIFGERFAVDKVFEGFLPTQRSWYCHLQLRDKGQEVQTVWDLLKGIKTMSSRVRTRPQIPPPSGACGSPFCCWKFPLPSKLSAHPQRIFHHYQWHLFLSVGNHISSFMTCLLFFHLISFFFFFFLQLHLQHMEVLRPGVE